MAEKKEIDDFLNSRKLKEEDMDHLWEESCKTYVLCKNLKEIGKNWKDLSIATISILPILNELNLTLVQERTKEEDEDSSVFSF